MWGGVGGRTHFHAPTGFCDRVGQDEGVHGYLECIVVDNAISHSYCHLEMFCTNCVPVNYHLY